ncbi:MAG: hypothetical protein CMI01_15430 [Oceanospirillaceae bacterium]|jgi:hypothetical protein|nr:hypothetical protein [Oceanospirillaceae bacterium]|tara:strand:- start:14708 stop:15418 length:711 start_codon:yes stop_codon:yes gene_type:complete
MDKNKHEVITLNCPENMSGGIMVCGYNFGFSREDEANEMTGIQNEREEKSFFSDPSVNGTRFKNKLVTLIQSWGVPLQTDPCHASGFERSFFQTNWIMTQTRSITGAEKIDIETLVENSESILNLIERRAPRVILFVGSQLIEALNDIRIRGDVERILGARPGNAVHHVSDVPTTGRQFKVLIQQFPHTTVVSIPHVTGTQGLRDDYMEGFAPLMREILLEESVVEQKLELCPEGG